MAAWVDNTADQTIVANGQVDETVQEAPPAATSGEPVPATEAPVLIAGPSGAPSASGAQPAVVVRTRQRRGSSSSVPVGNTTRAHPPLPSQLALPIVPPATGVRTSVLAPITQPLPPSSIAVPASHPVIPSTVVISPAPSVARLLLQRAQFPSSLVVLLITRVPLRFRLRLLLSLPFR